MGVEKKIQRLENRENTTSEVFVPDRSDQAHGALVHAARGANEQPAVKSAAAALFEGEPPAEAPGGQPGRAAEAAESAAGGNQPCRRRESEKSSRKVVCIITLENLPYHKA